MNYILLLFPLLLAVQGSNAEWLKYVLWWSLPLMFVGLCALGFTIYRFVKMFGKARMARVPLSERAEVEITRAGELNLSLESPRFAFFAGGGLDYELLSERDGRAVDLRATAASLMSRKVSGKVIFPVRSFQIAETGKYLLKVSGIKPDADYSAYFLIIESPTALKSVFYVLALILTGGMSIGGFVFSIIASTANK